MALTLQIRTPPFQEKDEKILLTSQYCQSSGVDENLISFLLSNKLEQENE